MATVCNAYRLLRCNIVNYQLLKTLERRLASLNNSTPIIYSLTACSTRCNRSLRLSPVSTPLPFRNYSDVSVNKEGEESMMKKDEQKAEDTNQTKSDEVDVLYRQMTVEVKGHDQAVINSYTQFLTMAANELGITVGAISTPPKKIKRMNLLKSAHIYKKHQVQYEMRTLFRVIELKHLTGSTADTFLEYIQRNLPEGMAMKVTRHRIETIPKHLKPPQTASAAST